MWFWMRWTWPSVKCWPILRIKSYICVGYKYIVMGIRRRIFIGFASLAIVLFLAGAIAMSELGRLRSSVQNIIDVSTSSAEQAGRMLEAVQAENRAVLQIVCNGNDEEMMRSYVSGAETFDAVLADATQTIGDRAELDAIYNANDEYRKIIDENIGTLSGETTEWFLNLYLTAYYRLDGVIKDYMNAPQHSVAMHSLLLEKSVYRTITPSILTLLVAFLIVCMFYYFLDLYYIRPILSINKGLKQYLDFGAKFNASIEGNGELSALKDNIDKLIGLIKSKSE